jgi:hypothetical protein
MSLKSARVPMVLAPMFAAALSVSAPAAAQVFIGPEGPFYRPGLPPPPPYAAPGYGRPGYGYGGPAYEQPYGGISCGEGAQIIAEQGFRRISPRECSGRVFRYTAFQRGGAFEVRVSSRTGQITQVRRIN